MFAEEIVRGLDRRLDKDEYLKQVMPLIEARKLFERAARSALVAWKGDYRDDVDLIQDLWVWYLESPSVQKKLGGAEPALAQTLARTQALNILAGKSLTNDVFNGLALYSSESVKDALLGVSDNRYLVDILPKALGGLASQNEGYAEAIRTRYEDGLVPQTNAAEQTLKHAVRSLTAHVNVIAITAGVGAEGNDTEGPGSRHAVFPESRKQKGDHHSDPTADMAINLALHGDEPITLCALKMAPSKKFGNIPQGIRGPGNRWLDSDQTTTLRKEFEGGSCHAQCA